MLAAGRALAVADVPHSSEWMRLTPQPKSPRKRMRRRERAPQQATRRAETRVPEVWEVRAREAQAARAPTVEMRVPTVEMRVPTVEMRVPKGAFSAPGRPWRQDGTRTRARETARETTGTRKTRARPERLLLPGKAADCPTRKRPLSHGELGGGLGQQVEALLRRQRRLP
jgi:hypothetical protein